MLNFLIQTFIICFSLIATYTWSSSENLFPYTLQLLGLSILLYFIFRMLFSNKGQFIALLDALLFSCVSLLLIINTGKLDSPLFFILYFLLFALSLLFDAKQSLLISLTIVILFLTDKSFTQSNQQIINLITLCLTSPLAISFGKRYLDSLESSGKISRLNKIITSEETDIFLWLSTRASPILTEVLDQSSQLIGSNNLPFRLQEKLKKIHSDLTLLHQSAKDLEDDIQEDSK